ncbi:glycoside hydrolase family 26 protein [Kitasatospora sp. NPDC050543]|uniref:glycoside hydrolase family 26 protein n=1 Tax=Kitasatospora sp. NPDC050543 TaxID=3364054 RepID=UPI0037A8F53A
MIRSNPRTGPGRARAGAVGRLLAAVALVLPLTGCAALLGEQRIGPGVALPSASSSTKPSTAARPAAAGTSDAFSPYDVRPLLRPAKKILGIAAEGAPNSMTAVADFTAKAGKTPNLIEYYSGWGDDFDTKGARNAWESGAIPLVAWEPYTMTLADIAAGKGDDYIKRYAWAVRDFNAPVAISFAHEMNGFWYEWGTKHATAEEFVAAYRHIHDLFSEIGAASVIWVWSPNSVNPTKGVQLQPYYPGDNYVDWVGIVAYYTHLEAGTFDTLYTPTLTQIRAFTDKPFLIAETGAEPGARKRNDILNLAGGVLARPDCLGFVWFNIRKEADWRIDSDPQALAAFKQIAADSRFGFDVKSP